MRVVLTVAGQLRHASATSLATIIGLALGSLFALAVLLNVLHQLLHKNPNEPPVVFHWVPLIGSTIDYGIDPYKFFFRCREKVRAIFEQ